MDLWRGRGLAIFFLSHFIFLFLKTKISSEGACSLHSQAGQRPASFLPTFCPLQVWPLPLPRRRIRAGPRSTTSASRAPTESSTTSAGRSAWAPLAGASGTLSRGRRTAPEEPGCAGVSRYERGVVGKREDARRAWSFFFFFFFFFAINRSAASTSKKWFVHHFFSLFPLSVALLLLHSILGRESRSFSSAPSRTEENAKERGNSSAGASEETSRRRRHQSTPEPRRRRALPLPRSLVKTLNKTKPKREPALNSLHVLPLSPSLSLSLSLHDKKQLRRSAERPRGSAAPSPSGAASSPRSTAFSSPRAARRTPGTPSPRGPSPAASCSCARARRPRPSPRRSAGSSWR